MENKVIEYISTDYGLCIKLHGRVCKYDLTDHIEVLRKTVDDIKAPFHVLFDCSNVEKAICSDTSRLFGISRNYMVARGLKRIAILYRSNAQIVDLTKVFNEATDKTERYISTMIHKDAVVQAVRYLKEGIEP